MLFLRTKSYFYVYAKLNKTLVMSQPHYELKVNQNRTKYLLNVPHRLNRLARCWDVTQQALSWRWNKLLNIIEKNACDTRNELQPECVKSKRPDRSSGLNWTDYQRSANPSELVNSFAWKPLRMRVSQRHGRPVAFDCCHLGSLNCRLEIVTGICLLWIFLLFSTLNLFSPCAGRC